MPLPVFQGEGWVSQVGPLGHPSGAGIPEHSGLPRKGISHTPPAFQQRQGQPGLTWGPVVDPALTSWGTRAGVLTSRSLPSVI